MRRFLIPSMLVTAWLLESSLGLAGETHSYPECRKQPSDSDIDGAKGAFQAGSVSFNEADYARAILYWEDAFRRDCTATLLLHHLAKAYEGQGNLEQSIVALRAYIDRTPDAAERPQIQRRIEVFEQKIAEEQQRAARAEEARRAQEADAKAESAVQAQAPSPATMNLYVNPIIPIAVGSVGLAATIVGGIIYFPASSDVEVYRGKCDKAGGQYRCSASDLDAAQSAESRRDWGVGVGVTGLILAVGGAGWYFFNETQKPRGPSVPKQPAMQPWVGPKFAGLSWTGSF